MKTLHLTANPRQNLLLLAIIFSVGLIVLYSISLVPAKAAITDVPAAAPEKCKLPVDEDGYYGDEICDDTKQNCGDDYKSISIAECKECSTGGFSCKSLEEKFVSAAEPAETGTSSITFSKDKCDLPFGKENGEKCYFDALCKNYGDCCTADFDYEKDCLAKEKEKTETKQSAIVETEVAKPVLNPAQPTANKEFTISCSVKTGCPGVDLTLSGNVFGKPVECSWKEGGSKGTDVYSCAGLPAGEYQAVCELQPIDAIKCKSDVKFSSFKVVQEAPVVPKIDCTQYATCSACQKDNKYDSVSIACGWDKAAGKCKAGSASGSADQSASGPDKWAWMTSLCNVKSISSIAPTAEIYMSQKVYKSGDKLIVKGKIPKEVFPHDGSFAFSVLVTNPIGNPAVAQGVTKTDGSYEKEVGTVSSPSSIFLGMLGTYKVQVTVAGKQYFTTFDVGLSSDKTETPSESTNKPDLYVADYRLLSSKTKLFVTLYVKNKGSANAGPFETSIKISGLDVTVKQECSSGLEKDKTCSVVGFASSTNLLGKTYDINVKLDSTSKVDESDETNNELKIELKKLPKATANQIFSVLDNYFGLQPNELTENKVPTVSNVFDLLDSYFES